MGIVGIARGTTLPLVLIAPAATLAGQPFTEEAIERGIDFLTTPSVGNGRGLAFVDLDDDGDPDIVTLGHTTDAVGVYENDGTGHFLSHTATSGIPTIVEAVGVIAADFDRDADLDLYISRFGHPNLLYRNDGGFSFTDVTESAGVGDDGLSHGCGWGDYNNDGWIDLYVANQDGPNRLFHNFGGGAFYDVAPLLGVDLNDPDSSGLSIEGSFQASFLDFDRDADADLYVTKIKGYCGDTVTPGGHLFENTGGAFVEITEQANAEGCVDSMCLAIGDFNGDGYHDLYQTGVPTGNSLLLSDGDGTFTPSEVVSDTISNALGWGAVFLDYNNDAVNDLFVCNTFEAERLYDHGSRFPCVDVSVPMGVGDLGRAYTCATADIDLDGDLDLLVQVQDEPVKLLINHEGQTRHWARFDIRGQGTRYAIGATIEVQAGGTTQVREVIAGCNYKNQNDLVQHVGLGTQAIIDQIIVVWPGGATRTLTDLPADATWVMHPTTALGDADGDGVIALTDLLVMTDCFTGDAPGTIGVGCEIMDVESDGDVDLADLALLLPAYGGPLHDCNDNGVADLEEIISGAAPDLDYNGQIDGCQIVGDLDGDGAVGVLDLLQLVADWGPCSSLCSPICISDLDGDCTVGVLELMTVLSNWG